jgi:hypothetical protein
MKNTQVRFICMVAAFMLATITSRADSSTYAQVIKERDDVLSQILAEREGKRLSGLPDEEAIAAAQLALYSFRRDSATVTGEKIKNQGLIIRIYDKKLELEKAKFSAGLAGRIQVLEATAPLLEAKQVLEELRLIEKKG